ncbi:acetylcholinesterase-like protein 4 [Sarcoptes scabiei]|uniref:Carboxylic ester hydrolase n=1 Tax=Sarcoptes scabiei TaxID=52283 RepID=A0A132AID9_SARSC|nr:acetylcholinesterase-like protein 4 [Sarcoptes scabiei]
MHQTLVICIILLPFYLNPIIANHIDAHQYISTGYDDDDGDSSLIVRTTKGLVRGQRFRTINYKWVDQFLSIPYAKPPKGELRFKHPRPIEPWEGVFNATSVPNACFQINDTSFGDDFRGTEMWNANTKLDEDCLILNIWVPYPRPRNSAVMVWIYGGSFNTGSTGLSIYDGKILASEENIILVSINYRVANLGFLYFEKARDEAPGNAGMFDQIMALHWIRDNIKFFGGNPDNVTLFGESAGAVSISFHLLSPLSRNLFSQAILQSGSATVPWGVTDPKVLNRRSLRLAEAVGCPHDENQIHLVIECLRNFDPYALVCNETTETLGVVEFAFTPMVDGSFLDSKPEDLLKKKDFKRTKLLMGSNKEEGSYFIVYQLNHLFNTSEDIYLTREEYAESIRALTPNVHPIGQDAIIHKYTDWLNPDDPIQNRDAIDKIVGDYHFTCQVNKMADRYASVGNEVYMYYFTHRSSRNPWPKWMGTMHGDEINFIFGEPLIPNSGYTEEEVALSKQIMKCWANFAKSGWAIILIVEDDHNYKV